MKWWVWLWVPLVIDQMTKWWLEPVAYNDGGIWGIGRGWEWGILVIISLATILIWFMREQEELLKLGLLILFSAGLSNFLDRLVFGGVRDFIWWPVLNVYGNIADILLVVGVGIIGFAYGRQKRGLKYSEQAV